ncbi:unnamed protein product [Acanthoscelides obtectus]|uniref:Uncharacterized protein n=1 Tax=Acanthoscelides obtectus TaxID=200917 RepID=A0A9P0Q171_ACAOB|nr:unnamed protein product [Acanthoscelides obtectus]CAK1679601.1 hypothetical protein AOBTE_LOCUS32379 [Acanthoscelides obtectus]
MTMTENAQSNITLILNSFDKFIHLIENPYWVKKANVEEIKTAFKLGSFIEKVIKNFGINELEQFNIILQKWWKTNNHYKIYDKCFFELACDKLLGLFFKTENIPENILEIAIRVYTSLYKQERLRSFLSKMIIQSSSVEAVADFVKIVSDPKELEYAIVLQHWTHLCQTKKQDIVKNNIAEMLKSYKVTSSLPILIGVLSIDDIKESDIFTQHLILQSLLDKLLDRSLLSKEFWIALCKMVDKTLLIKVCAKNEDFLISLLNFVVYTGSLMNKACQGVWQTDSRISFCTEIGYDDIFQILNSLVKADEKVRKVVIGRLSDAKSEFDSDIWDDLKRDLN